VQVKETAAEKIIEALNGINFRGRQLTVNYAKTRKDEADGNTENKDGLYTENHIDSSEIIHA
jgi:RNA recognition motif-containing protein